MQIERGSLQQISALQQHNVIEIAHIVNLEFPLQHPKPSIRENSVWPTEKIELSVNAGQSELSTSGNSLYYNNSCSDQNNCLHVDVPHFHPSHRSQKSSELRRS